LGVARDLGLDDTFLYEDPDEGWKISLYIEGCSELDYGNPDHVARALKMGRALHTSGKVSPYSFDFYDEGVKIAEILKRINYPLPCDFEELASRVGAIAAKMHFSAVSGGTSNFKQSSFFVLFIKCSHTFLFCAGIIQNISAGKRFPQISNANALLSQCFQQRQRQASQRIDFFLLCSPAFAERVAYATLFYQLLHIRSICLTKIPDCECQILRCHLRR